MKVNIESCVKSSAFRSAELKRFVHNKHGRWVSFVRSLGFQTVLHEKLDSNLVTEF
jgi:hypothetical protein